MRKVNPLRGASSSHDTPYLSALMVPVNDILSSSKASGKVHSRHNEVVMTAIYKQERPMDMINRKLPVAGVDGWHSRSCRN